MATASIAAEPAVVGFAPDSIYAEWSAEEREASDRMEAVYNHERDLEVHGPLAVSLTEAPPPSHFAKNPLRFTPDDSLRRLAKGYVREIEDIEIGDLPDDAKGRRFRAATTRLDDIECEQEFRQVLAETWQASENGTHSITCFHARGGLEAVVHHGATPPSYPLAVLLDYTNFLRDEPTVFDWPESGSPRGTEA